MSPKEIANFFFNDDREIGTPDMRGDLAKAYLDLLKRHENLVRAARQELMSHKCTLLELAPHAGLKPGKDVLVSGYIAEHRILERIRDIDHRLQHLESEQA